MATAASILTPEAIESYHKNGYLVLRGVFSESEAKVFQAECDKLLTLDQYVDPHNVRVAHRTYLNGEMRVEKLDPVHDISIAFSGLVADERILEPLRDIYMDEPLLFKDKLIFKLAGSDGYSMHQDAAYWQEFPFDGLISVMVAIDGASTENGGLELFSGYHDRLRSVPGELRNFNDSEISEIDAARGEIVETSPGDIIIFGSLTPHQSGRNESDRSRKQLFLTYSPSRNGDLYKAHYQHYRRYTHKDTAENYFL